MKKVSCRPFTFVPEVSNYSRGIFFSKKYEVLTLCCPYIVRRFSSVRKKFRTDRQLSCLKFPIIVDGKFITVNFLKHPAKGYGRFPLIAGGLFEKVQ